MASLLRGKQAGIQNDLSAGLDPSFFNIDDIARFGKSTWLGQSDCCRELQGRCMEIAEQRTSLRALDRP